jgi:hypothetical protein
LCNLQANTIKEYFVTLNFVEDVLSTDETVKVVKKRLRVLKELVDIADGEFGVLLGEMNSAEVVGNWLGRIRLHEISAYE